MALEIRRLIERDSLGTFSCGPGEEHRRLNLYLTQYAKLNQQRGVNATHVAVLGGSVVSFVTIAAGSIDPSSIPASTRGLGRYPQPVLVLGRMATDERHQKKGIGDQLIEQVVFPEALEMSTRLGCIGVYVDAKPGARSYYPRFGFQELTTVTTTATMPMFVPLAVVKARQATRGRPPPAT